MLPDRIAFERTRNQLARVGRANTRMNESEKIGTK